MKTQFLKMAAQELRTPLTSVLGYTEVMLTQKLDAPEHREVLDIVHQQAEHVTSIVNELLDLVRIDSRGGQDFVVQPLSLQRLAAEAMRAYQPAPGRRVPVCQESGRTLWVQGDRRKLGQVLGNLISNAYKHSPNGGEVTIAFLTRQPLVDLPAQAGIRVTDSGIGMTPVQQSHVFERFYRADTSGKIPGTGLGLCIAKEIIDLHGGRIEVQSAPGKGTTVTIRLGESLGPECLE